MFGKTRFAFDLDNKLSMELRPGKQRLSPCVLTKPGHGSGWGTHKLRETLEKSDQSIPCSVSVKSDGSIVITTGDSEHVGWFHASNIVQDFLDHHPGDTRALLRFFPRGNLLLIGGCGCIKGGWGLRLTEATPGFEGVAILVHLAREPLESCKTEEELGK